MKKTLMYIYALVMVIAFPVSVQSAQEISVCGTGDSQTMLREIASAFEADHPGDKVHVPESIGSGGGIKAAAFGKCELGRVARRMTEKEEVYGLAYRVFARSPVVFVVHPSVRDIEGLTADQITGIYSGRIKRWKETGSLGKARIYPVSREEGDSSTIVLNARLPGFRDIKEFTSMTVYSSPEAVETIVTHRYTIGYGTASMFRSTQLKVISIDGVAPTESNVADGSYALTLDFGIVYKGEPAGLSAEFIKYLYGHKAAEIMKEFGVVPIEK